MKDIFQNIDKNDIKIRRIDEELLKDNYDDFLFLKNYNSKIHFPTKDVDTFNRTKINDLYQYLEQEKAIVFGAFYNEKLIGFIWGYPHVFFDSNRMFINSLVVEKKYTKLGIGRRLVNELMKSAKEYNILEIDVTVAPNNQNAVEFYKHLGFESERVQMKLKI